jgi:hypothetical protein
LAQGSAEHWLEAATLDDVALNNGKGGGIFVGQGKEESGQIFTKKRREMRKVSSKHLVNRQFVVDAQQELFYKS